MIFSRRWREGDAGPPTRSPRRRARAAPSSRPSPRRRRRRRAHRAGALRRIRTSAAATRDRAVCRVPLEARWRRPGSDGDPSTAAMPRASSRRAVALAASLRPTSASPRRRRPGAQRWGAAADLAQRAQPRGVRRGPLRRPRRGDHGPHDRAGRRDRRGHARPLHPLGYYMDNAIYKRRQRRAQSTLVVLDVRMLTVGPLQENCYLVRAATAARAVHGRSGRGGRAPPRGGRGSGRRRSRRSC